MPTAKKSIGKVQHEALSEGFFDLLGTEKAGTEEIQYSDTAKTLLQLAAIYCDKLVEKLEAADAASSGRLSDSIRPTSIEVDGTKYSIGIEAATYASFVDEGVNGWAVNRGSRFQFKTRGVNPRGEMVKSLIDYLAREGRSARNVKVGISSREKKGMKITDATTASAIRAAFMIKRQGIKPTHFWSAATSEMKLVIENEVGHAIKIDIINFLNK